MDEHHNLPDANRLSVLAATILLAYAFSPFIKIPERDFAVQLPGFLFLLRFDFATLVSLFAAALAATGADWLLRGHPGLGDQRTLQHWLIPAVTAWAIGVPLNTLELGGQWWVVFAFGGALLVMVFAAEYIVVDANDARQAPATAALTAVSFALYLTLAITIRAAGMRLYLAIPALAITIGLVALRTLYLQLEGRWCYAWAAGIALAVGQLAMGLHYLPVSPLRFGLLLAGAAYALTSLGGAIEEGRPWRTLWVEPTVMLAVLWGIAFLLG